MLKKYGFTVVELLVVIVVIAILATITLVSYNNIQKDAYNTSIKAAVTAWVKALTINNATKGPIELDPGTYTTGICLGSELDYTTTSHLEQGECFSGAFTSNDVYYAVKANVGNIRFTPNEFEDPDADGDGQWLRGMVYDRTYSSADGYRYYLFYNMYGYNGWNFDCGVPGATVNDFSSTLKVTTCQIDMSGRRKTPPITWP